MSAEEAARPGGDPLARLQALLAAHDLPALLTALRGLDRDEREALEAELGARVSRRVLRAAARQRHGDPRGRVVVIPGFLGSLLAVCPEGRAPERIWMDREALAAGRFAELAVGADGPAPVRPAGPYRRNYLPLVVELAAEWEVLPFDYDWRLDIAEIADRLAAEVKRWAGTEPVHLVAHGMGGLVARRLARDHRQLWEAMADPDALSRGGRLVMLGVPNRGAWANALLLAGRDSVTGALAALDAAGGRDAVRRVVGTFPSLYQMLPPAALDGADEKRTPFDREVWGPLAVDEALLAGGRRFQAEMAPDQGGDAPDTARLRCVAGSQRPTVAGLRAAGEGHFEIRETLDGDGLVTHESGLLAGVDTFWLDEAHGDLPRSERLLEGIHELLAGGTTYAMKKVAPRTRAAAAAPRRSSAPAEPGSAALSELERLLLDPELPRKQAEEPGAGSEDEQRPRMTLEVVWGDITRAEGEVYAVGHYHGVLPQRAEWALDRAMSGGGDKPMMLTEYTRRGLLRGDLGKVELFPWRAEGAPDRVVAVGGMGHPGTFNRDGLRQLVRSLVWAISLVPRVETVCSVMIGSGDGGLTIAESVRALVNGVMDAARRSPIPFRIRRLKLVELYRDRAVDLHRRLERAIATLEPDAPVELVLEDGPTLQGDRARVSDEDGLALMLAAMVRAGRTTEPALLEAVRALAGEVADAGPGLASVSDAVGSLAERLAGDIEEIAGHLRIRISAEEGAGARRDDDTPTRISFIDHGSAIRVAAITATTTVPERITRVDRKLVTELIEKMTDPRPGAVTEMGRLLRALLLPREFRTLLDDGGPVVFEVDRTTAPVHWEMLAVSSEVSDDDRPLGVRSAVARQLRTTYSAPPVAFSETRAPLRALVVGDPGDPEKSMSLDGARAEAIAVRDLLEAHGVQVDAMIGAPGPQRSRELRGVAPASRIDFLTLMIDGGYDILHYSGHCSFDPEDPSRVGWVFARGLMTARELERVDATPSLVVANACVSSLTSRASTAEARGPDGELINEAGLLPGVADELFRRGTRNFIGTAWEISDVGAVKFAETLYEGLLGEPEGDGETMGLSIGEAVRAARELLYGSKRRYGSLWAAYQHYGDPVWRLRRPRATPR